MAKQSKTLYIIFTISSLCWSSPPINADNNPGKHNFFSSLFKFKKIGFIILDIIYFLHLLLPWGKNENKPYEYINKLSINLLPFFSFILVKIS